MVEFFDRYAADFDSIYGNTGSLANDIANKLFRRSMKLRFVKTLEGCQPVDAKDVLDIGCGPGYYSIALAQMGARSVFGIDFAESMLGIARARAQDAGVGDICRFEKADFFAGAFPDRFDYVVVMGFMDYMEDAEATIRRVLELTRGKAFFSFPVAGGLLAWQRKLRYRDRCALYLYTRSQIERLFESVGGAAVTIEKIERDFFVTATKV